MLHFYHGVMGSSKTAMLLMQRYNYLQLGLKVALVKPAVDAGNLVRENSLRMQAFIRWMIRLLLKKTKMPICFP